jgi:hypothetical protein
LNGHYPAIEDLDSEVVPPRRPEIPVNGFHGNFLTVQSDSALHIEAATVLNPVDCAPAHHLSIQKRANVIQLVGLTDSGRFVPTVAWCPRPVQ